MTKVESEETPDTSVERTSHTCTCTAHACMVVHNTLSSSSYMYVYHAHLYVHSSNLTIKALVARRLVTYMYNVMYMTYCNIHIHVHVHVRLLEKLNHFLDCLLTHRGGKSDQVTKNFYVWSLLISTYSDSASFSCLSTNSERASTKFFSERRLRFSFFSSSWRRTDTSCCSLGMSSNSEKPFSLSPSSFFLTPARNND